MKHKKEFSELKKAFLVIAALLIISVILIGNKLIQDKKIEFDANYKANQTLIIKDNVTKEVFGIIGDPHGEYEKASQIAGILKKEGATSIIIVGDLAMNNELREYNIKKSSLDDQIYKVLVNIANISLPTFVIPGNHETKQSYYNAVGKAQKIYKNIVDLTKIRIVRFKDINLVSLPGYQILETKKQRFIPNDGFYASLDDIVYAGKLANDIEGTTVLVTHGPPFTGSIKGSGTTYDGTDLGEKVTAEIMKNVGIKFSVFGHIHEAGGYASTLNGKSISENELSDELNLNAGTLETWKNIDGNTYSGTAAILTVENGKASYRMIRIE